MLTALAFRARQCLTHPRAVQCTQLFEIWLAFDTFMAFVRSSFTAWPVRVPSSSSVLVLDLVCLREWLDSC